MKAVRALAALSLALFMLQMAIQPTGAGVPGSQGEIAGAEPIYNGLKLADSEIGIIHGGENDTHPPAVYISGERLRGIVESKDGRRVTDREYITSHEGFVFGIYRIIEYRDINNNSMLDATSNGYGYHLLGSDIPVGGLSLNTSWRVRADYITEGGETQLTYIASKRSPVQDLRWNRYTGRMENYEGDVKASSVKITMNLSISESRGAEYLNGMEISGRTAHLSAKVTCEITRWTYEYPDSRLMIQSFLSIDGEGYLINISTASPRYMEINGSTEILFPKPIYGHTERISDGTTFIGGLNGNRECFENGVNTTYRDSILGVGDLSRGGKDGFSVIRGVMCGPSNSSLQTMYLNITQFVPDPMAGTDAAPPWMVGVQMVEAGAIAMLSVGTSYLRYRRR